MNLSYMKYKILVLNGNANVSKNTSNFPRFFFMIVKNCQLNIYKIQTHINSNSFMDTLHIKMDNVHINYKLPTLHHWIANQIFCKLFFTPCRTMNANVIVWIYCKHNQKHVIQMRALNVFTFAINTT